MIKRLVLARKLDMRFVKVWRSMSDDSVFDS